MRGISLVCFRDLGFIVYCLLSIVYIVGKDSVFF